MANPPDETATHQVSGDSGGATYGWVTRMGLMYVWVATRDGTEHLVPNEAFLTQKIENLSYSDNRLRLRIPFDIAYKSDLKKAMKLALKAARDTERVLKAPEPSCMVREYGDSNVKFEVRVWIEDPRQGLARVKSNVLLAIWETFHNNGIEFAFPQRDLRIVDSVMKGEKDDGPSSAPATDKTVLEPSPS